MKVIRTAVVGWTLSMFYVAFASSASADAPAWMHAAAMAPLPAHDEKTDAVLLYAEDITTVQPNGKIKNLRRRVFKILRPDGRWYGLVHAYFDSETKVTGIHGWGIPQSGKHHEIKDKEAIEPSPTAIKHGPLPPACPTQHI